MRRWAVPPPTEKVVQRHLVSALRALGCHVSVTSQVRASMVTIGLPDLWVVHPGWKLFCWIEVKRPGGRVSPAQQGWHAVNRAAGVPVVVVDSVPGLVRALQALGAPIQD